MLAAGWGSWIGRRKAVAGALVGALVLGPAFTSLAATPANSPGSDTGPGSAPVAGHCSVAAGTWPEYQGDPSHAANACSQLGQDNVAGLRPAWFVPTKGAVTDTPAVAFGSVFAGDYSGEFYALDRSTGRNEWTFDTAAQQMCFRDAPIPHADTHSSGFGRIPSSPATATIDGRNVVFVASGGSLFALDAGNGACLWAEDTDPGKPSNSIEIESSPVVDNAVTPPEVLVGNDDNSSAGVGVTGLMAFDAETGDLLWKYEPERDLTLTPGQFNNSPGLALSCGDGSPNPYCDPTHIPGLAPNDTQYADACGDVWSSPALDTSFQDPMRPNGWEGSGPQPTGWTGQEIGRNADPKAPEGLVVFGTGNCAAKPNPATALDHGDYVDNQGIFALDPVTGVRVWNFVEPYNQYDNNANEPGAGDDDFGSSAIVAHLPSGSVAPSACPPDDPKSPSSPTTLVIEGSKAGFAYGLCAANGGQVWSVQAAQPGQLSNDLIGAMGGFLGSPSMGQANGRPTVFFTSAIPTPLSNDGIREPGDGDTNIASCPGLAQAPLLPACPDLTILDNPQRLVSLHAIDAATGHVVYQAPSLPTYAASTYTNGVVFLPDSLAAGVAAFNADTGTPIWAFPLGAVPASAAAIAGQSIYLGTGETDGSFAGQTVPPQLTGIWSFTTSSPGAPAVPAATLPAPLGSA